MRIYDNIKLEVENMEENYIVKYWGHSSYSVETKNHFIVFDYVEDASFKLHGETLHVSQSKINFDNIKKPIMMFNSHTHFDHYNRELNEKLSNNDNIFTIVGGPIKSLKNTTYLLPGDSINIKDIQIYASTSTDMGVCYLLEVDGIIIYYAGDNIDWGDGEITTANYLMSMSALYDALNDNTINIGFVPVCNYSEQMYDSITDSAIYICRELGIEKVYPMHSKSSIKPYEIFKNICEQREDVNFEVIVLPQEN